MEKSLLILEKRSGVFRRCAGYLAEGIAGVEVKNKEEEGNKKRTDVSVENMADRREKDGERGRREEDFNWRQLKQL